MGFIASKHVRSVFFATMLGMVGAMPAPSTASVIESSPTFPVIPMSFASPTGAGCFTIAGVCLTPGTFTLTSATSTFAGGDQDIAGTATYTGSLTPLVGSMQVGEFTLTGTVDLEVLGRTSSTKIGSWATELTSLTLTGLVDITVPSYDALNGKTLLATLGGVPSTGMLSIAQISTGLNRHPDFVVNSFFDVFIDVSLEGTGLGKMVGPISITAVPEPATWMMLISGFGALGALSFRRSSRRTAPARAVCGA